jgi:hypothetical protein
MKTLTALALLVAVVAPTIGNAAWNNTGCNTCAPTCNTCAPVAVQKCYEPVCKTCICCPKVQGFLERNW